MKKVVFAVLACFTSVVFAAPAALVKGAIDSRVTQENLDSTVCVPGYTKTVRPPVTYTNKLKAKQIREFGLTGSMKDYEEDHLIPLAIGGNPTSPDNLWPQPWEGKTSAKKKDRLEVKLQKLVCSGKISLKEAQDAIATDWISAYDKYVPDPMNKKRR